MAGVLLTPGARNVPYPGDDLDIEERLKGDLDKAREYQAACGESHSLVKDIPSGIPPPDADMRIRLAGEASRAALQNYTRALRRFSQYTLSGIVPEDLLPAA
jgi:hypothetical protein